MYMYICIHICIHMFINGDLPHLEYPGPVLIKQKLTAVPSPHSSWKMFDMLYSRALNKMLQNLYLNANFDGCWEVHVLSLQWPINCKNTRLPLILMITLSAFLKVWWTTLLAIYASMHKHMHIQKRFCWYFENSYCSECLDRQQTSKITNLALTLASVTLLKGFVRHAQWY